MVLVSLTYAVAAVRMARRGVLAQQLNAIESLASVEVICIDKTGTLTESALRVADVLPVAGRQRGAADGVRSGASPRPRLDAQRARCEAIAEASPAAPEPVARGGAVQLAARVERGCSSGDATYVPGRAGALLRGRRALARVRRRAPARRAPRAGAAAAAARSAALADGADDEPRRRAASRSGSSCSPSACARTSRETIAFLLEQGVEVKVLSGDAPETVACDRARRRASRSTASATARRSPTIPRRCGIRAGASVVGRISPEGKRAIVAGARATRAATWRWSATASTTCRRSSAARLAIAQGSGAQMARSVADLVLVDGDFAIVPRSSPKGAGRLRNLQRVTQAVRDEVGVRGVPDPHDRHHAPTPIRCCRATSASRPRSRSGSRRSSSRSRPAAARGGRRGSCAASARFAVPAGTLVGRRAVVAGYLFALHDLDYCVADARTIADDRARRRRSVPRDRARGRAARCGARRSWRGCARCWPALYRRVLALVGPGAASSAQRRRRRDARDGRVRRGCSRSGRSRSPATR